MRNLFKCEVGLSDHTMGIGAAVAAVSLGTTIIEKHFTVSRSEGGVDSTFSLEPSELKNLVIETERARLAQGTIHYGPTESESWGRTRRRSLYIAEDMKAGDILTTTNLRKIRPGLGLPPKFYDVFLGKAIKYEVRKGTPASWDMI